MSATILATDLDGTFLPLDNEEMHFQALNKIWERRINNTSLNLYFVTGRHFTSVKQVITEYALPTPDRIICDGGASIFENMNGEWFLNSTYEAHLLNLAKHFNKDSVMPLLNSVNELTLQEVEHQSPCKISYYTPAEHLITLATTVSELLQYHPLSVAHSFDPSTKKGQIDILPKGISKAYALLWLWESGLLDKENLIYAGDAQSDLPVFESGISSIVVANASSNFKELLKQSTQASKIYFSVYPSTTGVLEGCDHYKWV